MTETSQNVTWLTQEAYDRLKEELDFLTGEGRAEIVGASSRPARRAT